MQEQIELLGVYMGYKALFTISELAEEGVQLIVKSLDEVIELLSDSTLSKDKVKIKLLETRLSTLEELISKYK